MTDRAKIKTDRNRICKKAALVPYKGAQGISQFNLLRNKEEIPFNGIVYHYEMSMMDL